LTTSPVTPTAANPAPRRIVPDPARSVLVIWVLTGKAHDASPSGTEALVSPACRELVMVMLLPTRVGRPGTWN
jgi:hypothetical protein